MGCAAWRVAAGLAAGVALGTFAQGAAAQEAARVSVETVDGRVLVGAVDARTDERTLWLRQEEAGVYLTVPVAWDAVTAARAGEQSLRVDELRSRAAELASPGPRWLLPEVETPADGVQLAAYATPVGLARRVRAVEIVSACLVNLDRDVEPDGLEVAIAAVAEDGAPTAVRGNLSAVVHGERRPLLEPEVDFGELGRWNQRVRSEDFVDGVATYTLPFRNTAPEWEFDLLPGAVLTVQLGATGHGNFSAAAPVVVRAFNPLRDDLQLQRGTRFLPNEVQGWRPQAPLGGRAGRWQWWGW